MFSYNGANIGTVALDRVRFEINDTVQATHQVEDEEITALLTLEANNVFRVCAKLCNMLAMKYAREGETRGGAAGIQKNNVMQNYLRMAKIFTAKATVAGSFRLPAGSQDTKTTHEEDDDIPQPNFKRGLFDNPDIAATNELTDN